MTWNTGELSRRIVSGLPVIHSQSLANLPTSRDFGGIGILRKAENGGGTALPSKRAILRDQEHFELCQKLGC
jgi:hypothetical protein